MRMGYNPGGILDFTGIWKGFLSGSLSVISFILGIVSESELAVSVYLALFVIAVFIFINSTMRDGGASVYFFQTLFAFGAGAVFSIGFGLAMAGEAWLAVVIILVIITYAIRYGSLILKRVF